MPVQFSITEKNVDLWKILIMGIAFICNIGTCQIHVLLIQRPSKRGPLHILYKCTRKVSAQSTSHVTSNAILKSMHFFHVYLTPHPSPTDKCSLHFIMMIEEYSPPHAVPLHSRWFERGQNLLNESRSNTLNNILG